MTNWTKRLDSAEKFFEKALTHGRNVYKRYEDERDDRTQGVKQANFFYANVNTLKESLYNSLPKPSVSRLHKGDYDNDVARVASLICQRALTYEVKCAKSFDEAIKAAIFDRLVPGIGQAWLRFDVDLQEVMVEGEEEPVKQPVPGTEAVYIDTVFWEDFGYEPARTWSSVGWVYRRHCYTKEEIVERYGEGAAQELEEAVAKIEDDTPKELLKDKFYVYEIWNKADRTVIHWSKAGNKVLRKTSDPLKLKDFFPCPAPLIANVTTKKFLPITDYHIAQDQYTQLNTIYARIQLIIEAVKVAGLYASEAGNTIARLLNGCENQLIPVDQWAMFAEKGGMKGMIDWYPVENVVVVLQQLQGQFEAAKGVLYEITGMSDIIRGASNPYETKGAQQIKAQFASVRMNGYQRDVSTFVRDVLRIMSEIVFQLYSPEKVRMIVGELSEPDRIHEEAAYQVLASDFLTMYQVDIEPDSLTQADWALEKEQRMEVVQNLGQMIQAVMGMGEGTPPELAVLSAQMIKFAISGFKGAAELEGFVDQTLDTLTKQIIDAKNNPQPPQPSPEEIKAKAEMERSQMQFQLDSEKAKFEAQLKGQEAQAKMMLDERKAQLDAHIKQMELEHKRVLDAMEIQMKEMEIRFLEKKYSLELEYKERDQQLKESQRKEQEKDNESQED